MDLNADQTALENAVNQSLSNFGSLASPLASDISGVSATIGQMVTCAASLGAASCGILQADMLAVKDALDSVLAKLEEAQTLLAAISVQKLQDDLNSGDQFGKVS